MLRLALVSSSPLVRAGLRAALAEREGIEIALDTASIEAARDLGYARAEALIVDADDATDTEALLSGPPAVLLVEAESARAGDWLADGLSVLPHHASIDAIAAAAHAVAGGLVAATPALWTQALRWARAGERAGSVLLEPMTPREREVLVQMARGLGNREIASQLSISPHTAKFHVAQIIAKLDARTRAHAVAKAVSAGLVEEPG